MAPGTYNLSYLTSHGCEFTSQYIVDATPIYGCTNPLASNYDPNANVDDGSCTLIPAPIYGCTDPNATNYNPAANVDDGSCIFPPLNQIDITVQDLGDID